VIEPSCGQPTWPSTRAPPQPSMQRRPRPTSARAPPQRPSSRTSCPTPLRTSCAAPFKACCHPPPAPLPHHPTHAASRRPHHRPTMTHHPSLSPHASSDLVTLSRRHACSRSSRATLPPVYDKDGNGSIDSEELREVMRSLHVGGPGASVADVMARCAAADRTRPPSSHAAALLTSRVRSSVCAAPIRMAMAPSLSMRHDHRPNHRPLRTTVLHSL
jgi:hypothetical protein